ncbi:BCCT family transporter [Pseudoalteromonas ruthenica]|uniref:BCCT family transporter n=1 Tax=Pseudoalteromonas ruthenica TaxID=151081 RepID=UPI0009E63537|nr:BCCT family transporter [Pseudoalteromonas ruthenica]TMO85128.1 choline transporter [Pseudoalteromonas ruthenica]TMO91789.1 choline transporter [Pseudoalteromonas ruthenica]TMP00621.1 choline transporter [Pseudoalteromonas ruthenica]TMP05409.1 choline transporter [Pseudoalteromonas ruthenica]TMP13011.1 choline transporter [Pseudoalteromonas ruthenica]
MKNSLERKALVVCVAIAAITALWPQGLKTLIQPAIQTAIAYLGSGFFLFVNALLLALLMLCFSPLAGRKMGGADAQKEFSTFGWLAMLFAAGMGSGLVFWGVAEPVLHSHQMPLKHSMYPEPVAASMALTMLNWGFHAWALYAVFGLMLGGVTRAIKNADDLSAPVLHALPGSLGVKHKVRIKRVIYFVAIIAIFFGVVGTIANASMLLKNGVTIKLEHYGLSLNAHWVGALMLLAITALYVTSARFGLRRGIQVLSKFNVYLAFIMMALVILTVPLKPILSTLWNGLKEYLLLVVSGAWQFDSQLKDADWASTWTYNYYFWWLAWGPFVGLFLARISRGRPLWQYILGVTIIPTMVSLVWFSVLGGSALALDSQTQADLAAVISADYTQGVFIFFSQLGGVGELLAWLSLLLLMVFVATSADSALLVIRQLCESVHSRASLFLWSSAMAVISLALLLIADEPLNRNIAVIGGIPFLLIFIVQLVGFIRAFTQELLDDSQQPPPE